MTDFRFYKKALALVINLKRLRTRKIKLFVQRCLSLLKKSPYICNRLEASVQKGVLKYKKHGFETLSHQQALRLEETLKFPF